MTLCNIRHTESVSGPHNDCPRAACGPRASVWTTLVYMNWIDSHSRLDQGATGPSDRIAAACDQSRNGNQH